MMRISLWQTGGGFNHTFRRWCTREFERLGYTVIPLSPSGTVEGVGDMMFSLHFSPSWPPLPGISVSRMSAGSGMRSLIFRPSIPTGSRTSRSCFIFPAATRTGFAIADTGTCSICRPRRIPNCWRTRLLAHQAAGAPGCASRCSRRPHRFCRQLLLRGPVRIRILHAVV